MYTERSLRCLKERKITYQEKSTEKRGLTEGAQGTLSCQREETIFGQKGNIYSHLRDKMKSRILCLLNVGAAGTG